MMVMMMNVELDVEPYILTHLNCWTSIHSLLGPVKAAVVSRFINLYCS